MKAAVAGGGDLDARGGKGRALLALLGIIAFGVALVGGALALLSRGPRGPNTVVVGSKRFTESVILAEIVSEALEQNGIEVERNFFLGGTLICFSALQGGSIDLYPEYTGTGLTAILKEKPMRDPGRVMNELRSRFHADYALTWMDSLGFSDAYALAMPRKRAEALGIKSISDLRGRRDLTAGFASEFLARADDGWPGLERHYGLAFAKGPFAMEAGLMYRAATDGQVDVISAYSTDGRLRTLDFLVLDDDLAFFPPYEAALVVRDGLVARVPRAEAVLRELPHTITGDEMRQMNAEAESSRPVAEIAHDYFVRHPLARVAP